MNIKKEQSSLRLIKYYNFSQCGLDQIPAPSKRLISNVCRCLSFFPENKIMQAIDNFVESEWWQEIFRDATPEWFFKNPARIKKLLLMKKRRSSQDAIDSYKERFVNYYNWCLVCQFHNYAEMHPFIDESTKGVESSIDFFISELQTIKDKINGAIGHHLDRLFDVNNSTALFLYLVDPFNRSESPPPLYYYYSEGLLADFDYDRIIKAFTLMNDWKMIGGLDLKKKPEFVIVPKNRVHECKPSEQAMKLIEEAFSGKHK